MEVAAASLGDDVDGAAGTPAVFGLVVRGEHLDFGDRVEAGREERTGVRPGIQVRDAVVSQIDGVVAAAVYGQAADVVPAGRLAVWRIDVAGEQAEHAH